MSFSLSEDQIMEFQKTKIYYCFQQFPSEKSDVTTVNVKYTFEAWQKVSKKEEAVVNWRYKTDQNNDLSLGCQLEPRCLLQIVLPKCSLLQF